MRQSGHLPEQLAQLSGSQILLPQRLFGPQVQADAPNPAQDSHAEARDTFSQDDNQPATATFRAIQGPCTLNRVPTPPHPVRPRPRPPRQEIPP